MNVRLVGQDADRVLPEPETAALCGIPLSTWSKMRRRGETPPAIQLSERRRGYWLSVTRDWLDSRTARQRAV